MKIKIEKLVYGGSGLGRLDNGKVVLVPHTIDGENITICDIQEQNKASIGVIESITERSYYRVEPPCPYFYHCGGCQYMHIAYAHQLAIKKSILCSQLERLGGISKLDISDTIPSPDHLAYRNHVQFHIDKDGRPGFQRARSHEIIPIEKCLLLEDTLNDLLHTIVLDPSSGITRMSIRDDAIGTPVLALSGETVNPPSFEIDFPLNVVYRGPAGEMRLSGEAFNQFDIGGKTFQVSSASFFQTNRKVAERLIELLLEHIPREINTILDCYCGVGLFSAFLAERTRRLIGIETSETACSDFAVNLDCHDHVELYQGSAEDILPHLEIKADLVVVDPPRAGIAPAAMKAIIGMRPTRIAYISCDPSTLARDLKILTSAGFNIVTIIPLDMFPQTYHIETFVLLTRD